MWFAGPRLRDVPGILLRSFIPDMRILLARRKRAPRVLAASRVDAPPCHACGRALPYLP